jgi:hypothetical protein
MAWYGFINFIHQLHSAGTRTRRLVVFVNWRELHLMWLYAKKKIGSRIDHSTITEDGSGHAQEDCYDLASESRVNQHNS